MGFIGGVDEELPQRLERLSRQFFAQAIERKIEIRMALGGRATYIAAMTELGHILMESIALSLGLEPSYFADRYTQDPLILFRIFNYPPDTAPLDEKPRWGVGEHTDYGVLTILKQDDSGGLEVQGRSRSLSI